MFYLVLFIDINRHIRRIDTLKVYFMFCLYLVFVCIQCNFIYILNIRVLVSFTSCLDNFDPMSV